MTGDLRTGMQSESLMHPVLQTGSAATISEASWKIAKPELERDSGRPAGATCERFPALALDDPGKLNHGIQSDTFYQNSSGDRWSPGGAPRGDSNLNSKCSPPLTTAVLSIESGVQWLRTHSVSASAG